jgi:hypothetical protein
MSNIFVLFFCRAKAFFLFPIPLAPRHHPKRKKEFRIFHCVRASLLSALSSACICEEEKKTQLRKVTFVMRKCSASHPRLSHHSK